MVNLKTKTAKEMHIHKSANPGEEAADFYVTIFSSQELLFILISVLI